MLGEKVCLRLLIKSSLIFRLLYFLPQALESAQLINRLSLPTGAAGPEARTLTKGGGPAMSLQVIRESEGQMNRCDWRECLAAGLFDGVHTSLLNTIGRENIPVNDTRFMYLCPKHFRRGVAHFNPDEVRK